MERGGGGRLFFLVDSVGPAMCMLKIVAMKYLKEYKRSMLECLCYYLIKYIHTLYLCSARVKEVGYSSTFIGTLVRGHNLVAIFREMLCLVAGTLHVFLPLESYGM